MHYLALNVVLSFICFSSADVQDCFKQPFPNTMNQSSHISSVSTVSEMFTSATLVMSLR